MSWCHSERGLTALALLPMLVLLLLFTTLSLQRLDFTLSQLKNRAKNQTKSSAERNRSLLELEADLLSGSFGIGERIRCSSPPFQYCHEVPQTNTGPSRLRNYNRFFEVTTPCPELAIPYDSTADWGKPPAVTSSQDCNAIEKGVNVMRYKENIHLNAKEFGKPLLSLPNILGSLGSIRIEGPVVLTHDTFILAGGDLMIDDVETENGAAYSLYLYAATGRVEVQNLSQEVHLSTFSRDTGWEGSWQILLDYPEALPPLEALFLGRTP